MTKEKQTQDNLAFVYSDPQITEELSNIDKEINRLKNFKPTPDNKGVTADDLIRNVQEKINNYQVKVARLYTEQVKKNNSKVSIKEFVDEVEEVIKNRIQEINNDPLSFARNGSKKFEYDKFVVTENILKNLNEPGGALQTLKHTHTTNNPETRAKIAEELSQLDMTGADEKLKATHQKAINDLNTKGQIKLIELLNKDPQKFAEIVKFALKYDKLENKGTLAPALESYLKKHANPQTIKNIEKVCKILDAKPDEKGSVIKAFSELISALAASLGLGKNSRMANDLKTALSNTAQETLQSDYTKKSELNEENTKSIKSFVEKVTDSSPTIKTR